MDRLEKRQPSKCGHDERSEEILLQHARLSRLHDIEILCAIEQVHRMIRAANWYDMGIA